MAQRKVGRRHVWPSWLVVVIVGELVATALRDGNGARVAVLVVDGAFVHHHSSSQRQFHCSPLHHHEKNVDDMEHNDMRESKRRTPLLSALQHPNNRRDVLLRAPSWALASSLLVSPVLDVAHSAAALEDSRVAMIENIPKRTIVITGANSGIGFQACRQLAQRGGGGHTIVLACRTLAKAQDAVQRLQGDGTLSSLSSTLIPACCDLADLSSIATFAQTTLPAFLQNNSGVGSRSSTIDVLCLNAGVSRNTAATDCARTKDGFELTGTCPLLSTGRACNWMNVLVCPNKRNFPLTQCVTHLFAHRFSSIIDIPAASTTSRTNSDANVHTECLPG
jgi:short chain dehydrogenase